MSTRTFTQRNKPTTQFCVKLAILSILMAISPTSLVATPYFRLLDPKHPQANVGACTDPVNVGHSQQCTVVSVIHHSPADGHILIPGEDWSLLDVGYALSGEGVNLVVGPSWNVVPVLEWLATLGGLPLPKLSLPNNQISGSFGPALVYDPLAGHGGKGYFRLFAGMAWKF